MNEKLLKRTVDLAYALFDPKHEERCFVICAAWYKGRIIRVGINQNKTHTINNRNPLICRRTGGIVPDKHVCAELNCFIGIKNTTNLDMRRVSLVNVRIDRQMRVRYSKPCNSCKSLLKFMQPKELWFSGDSGEFEQYCD